MADKRICYFVDETMLTPDGVIPSVVTEGEPRHQPLVGSGRCATPWYWGSIEEAKAIAAEENERLGLSADDVVEIIASSMRASLACR